MCLKFRHETPGTCVFVSTVVCPGPVLAEAPSNKRNCCIQDTPKQMMCCAQQKAWGRSVPPTHSGGCTCNTHTNTIIIIFKYSNAQGLFKTLINIVIQALMHCNVVM